MLYKVISLSLVTILLHGSIAAQAQSPIQTLGKMQKVVHKAQEKDKAVNVSLKQKIDKQHKFSGKVSEISDTGFTLVNQKTGKLMKLAYEDVEEVRQKGMSKGAWIAIGVVSGIVVAAIIVGYTITGGD